MIYTVLGASGFIGSHLTAYLRASGHEVYAPEKGSRDIFERDLGHAIYSIGLTADFRRRPFATVDAHVCFLNEVLRKCRFTSLTYLSSTRVYGRNSAGMETESIAIDPFDPSDLYNVTKLAGELICRSCGRDNVRVARLSNVVGEGDGRENFIFALIEEALRGKIHLRTSLHSEKDYVLVDDVVKVLPLICERGIDFIYNLASGKNLRNKEIVELLQKLTDCQVYVDPDATTRSFPKLSIELLKRQFEFKPEPVLEGLSEIILRKNRQTKRVC